MRNIAKTTEVNKGEENVNLPREKYKMKEKIILAEVQHIQLTHTVKENVTEHFL